MKTIAVIPARGGSKRIPRKNIKPFAGKPMLAHAIAAAQDSRLFDRIVVSTEDEEIAETARRWGAETPFSRPPELADDFVPIGKVVADTIRACRALGWKTEYVCCILPCVPLLRAEDIQAGYALLLESGADYAFPVAQYDAAIQRALRRSADGRMQPLHPEYETRRSQDLEPAYYDAGQFWWGPTRAWLENPSIHTSGVGLPIPSWRAVDIDTEEDWTRAERLFAAAETKA